MINPAAAPDIYGEWFELYNTTGVSQDLKGCVITNGSTYNFTIAESLIIEAYGRLVIGREGNTVLNGGVTPDYVYSGLSLSNTSDSIIIATASDEVIDAVYYDSDTWPVTEGASMSLDPAAQDAISNELVSNWCTGQSVYGDGDYGTPGNTNDHCNP